MNGTYPVDMECRCGCGARITAVSKATYHRLKHDKPVGYLPGHRSKGSLNPRWNGGQSINQDGYRLVSAPLHPMARPTGYALEHRLVMAEHLGRVLHEDEIVHHRNRDTLDNRIQNLQLVTREEHAGEIHPPPKRREYPPKICATCGRGFLPVEMSTYTRARFCSRKCTNVS